jgi:hypothetical protein
LEKEKQVHLFKEHLDEQADAQKKLTELETSLNYLEEEKSHLKQVIL